MDFSGKSFIKHDKQDFKTSILRQTNFKGKLIGASFFDADLTGFGCPGMENRLINSKKSSETFPYQGQAKKAYGHVKDQGEFKFTGSSMELMRWRLLFLQSFMRWICSSQVLSKSVIKLEFVYVYVLV